MHIFGLLTRTIPHILKRVVLGCGLSLEGAYCGGINFIIKLGRSFHYRRRLIFKTVSRVNHEEFVSQNATARNTSEPIRSKLEGTIFANLSREQYLAIYTGAMAVMLFLSLNRSFSFFYLCLRASIRLHDQLFRGITRATMYFFNTNPSGRILNRFSRDIGCIDIFLPSAMMDCILVE